LGEIERGATLNAEVEEKIQYEVTTCSKRFGKIDMMAR